jgi:hypothetical protein
VVFAGYFLAAHDADLASAPVIRPWRLAFDAAVDLSDLMRILLALNAHINYDLPKAMIAMISAADFDDAVLLAQRHRDHERIDGVISSQVSAETPDAGRRGGWSALSRRMLAPANRWSSRRFLRVARRDVWHNVAQLQQARLAGADAYAVRLGQLEALAAAKIADLLRPGPLLLRLALTGFGVRLPAH